MHTLPTVETYAAILHCGRIRLIYWIVQSIK